MSLRVFTSGQIQLDNHEIPLWVTQGRHGTIVYTPADLRLPGGKRTEHPMPHKRYALAYDTSDKPNVAGCLQFEADIRALLAEVSAPAAQGLELANCEGGKWLTVVYRDIQPGDESRTIGEHPKVSALSWSHALHDRAARQAAQEEVVALKERIARAGVEHRRALHEAVLEEREACAKVCEGFPANRDWVPGSLWGNIRSEMSAAIRARTT